MSEPNPQDHTDAFIKAAQYIARLTAQQDLLEELGNIIVKYFGADWVAFVGADGRGEINLRRCTVADEAFRRALLEKGRETIRDVLDTGFLGSMEIEHASACNATLLPVGEGRKNRVAAIVGHSTPPSQELLNLYLAISGLAGSTMGRISTERELRLHQGHLEELVRERTAALEASKDAAQKQGEWLSVTLASIGDAVIATDDAGRITYMNAVAEGLTGWTLGEAATRPVTEVFNIINEQSRKTVENPVARVLQEGLIVGLANHTVLVRRDGTEVPLDDSAAPMRDKDGKMIGVVLVFRDITERKVREDRITRLTRLYAMLVRVNEAIVRILDRGRLYDEACRIIAEESELPLVWIGETRDGGAAPVAVCGTAADFVEEIKMEAGGGGLALEAYLREGRPVVHEDLSAAVVPLRESAVRRGFKGAAVFPLHCQGKIVAVLALYSATPHEFDAEQVGLFGALTADLSYALDTIEQEKVRAEVEANLHRSLKRFELLAHTAEELLQSPDPQELVNSLCRDVMEHLGCHAFFNFLAVEEAGRLRLNAYAGIPEEEAEKIKWLDYGVAVCGCAARDACRIVAEHIPTTPDPRTELVSSYGIKAYACHPLYGPEGKPMGTLSFGTRDRETFSDEDLSLMKAVADQVAVAMMRMRDEEALKKSRDELEERVKERTEEVRRALETVGVERKRLYDVLETVPIMICLLTPDHHVAFANRSFREKFGESEGRHCYEYCFGFPEPCPFCESYKALETGKPHHWEVTTPDGSHVIDAYDFPFTDVDGSPLILEMDIDITDRRRAEEALRVASVYNRSLIEASVDPFVTIDPRGRISDVNAATEQATGYSRDELIGTDFSDYFTDRVKARAGYRMVFDEGVVRDYPLEIRHREGRITTVLYNASVYRDTAGSVIGVFAAARDVSERQKLETQLRQAQKMEALGTLSGGIAHDFNNILAAIIGFTELIKDHSPKESRQRRHAQRVFDAAVRGRELVRQMLTFSRQTEQEMKPLLLSSIVKESAKLLRASIPSTVSIRVSVKSESGFILGDPTRVSQVLMNLATNAAYAMREKGGTLDIELSDFSVSASSGNPHGIEPGLYMKLTVRDTGTGIPPEIVDRIFDPFFTTKNVGEGTGLGLSVVLGIVKQARGYITVESEPDKGSTFDVYFPKAAEEPATEKGAADETIPLGNERILFVDDEEALVQMGEELLAELGYEVTSRTSSREAFSLLKEDPSRFDLIITDVTMPEMTGIDLAREALAVRPDLPIILCTGHSHLVDANTAEAAGVKAFAMKPLTKREIAKTIRRVLDG